MLDDWIRSKDRQIAFDYAERIYAKLGREFDRNKWVNASQKSVNELVEWVNKYKVLLTK